MRFQLVEYDSVSLPSPKQARPRPSSFNQTCTGRSRSVRQEGKGKRREKAHTATNASHSPLFSQSGVRCSTVMRGSTSSAFDFPLRSEKEDQEG